MTIHCIESCEITVIELKRKIFFSGPRFPDNSGELLGYIAGWGADSDSTGRLVFIPY